MCLDVMLERNHMVCTPAADTKDLKVPKTMVERTNLEMFHKILSRLSSNQGKACEQEKFFDELADPSGPN